MREKHTPEEIEAAARDAGLTLTPEWRDALVEGSRGVLVARRAIRSPRDMAAEPAHVFPAAKG